jgi:pimeloyl-ACP methyl ester carboxylesterase
MRVRTLPAVDRAPTGPGELPPEDPPAAPWEERALGALGAALDAAALRAAALVVERALIPTPESLAAIPQTAGALLDPALLAAPRRFFSFLDEPRSLGAVETRSRRRRLPGGRVLAHRVESAYQPFEGGATAPSPGPVPVTRWVHDAAAPATIVALHGFGMGRPDFDAGFLLAARWFEVGYDVALPALPGHGVRKPADARLSGQVFTIPHVARLAEAVREAVYEVDLVVRWLRAETGRPVGLLGISLGGYVTALAAGLLDDLAFAIPVAAPVDMGDMAWRFLQRTRYAREGLPGVPDAATLRRAFRVHSPLAHPLRLPRERVLIAAARGDRIVPPQHPLHLARHWGDPEVRWLAGGHLALFGRQALRDAVLAHLRGLGHS